MLKRQKLLFQLQNFDPKFEDEWKEATTVGEKIANRIEQLNGYECSVPVRQPNGQVVYHDAILQTNDQCDYKSVLNFEEIELNAYWMYPLQTSMIICPYFVKNNCKFNDGCKYSHGVSVTLAQVKPKLTFTIFDDHFQEKLHGNCLNNCLIRLSTIKPEEEDGQWCRVKILVIDEDLSDKSTLIELHQSDERFSVNIEDLVLMDSRIEETSEDRDCRELEEEICDHIACDNQFGDWERFTKGIGTKLMAKMGYLPGQGLGINSDGIVDPIESYVFPNGKSLDVCLKMKKELLQKKSDINYILKRKADRIKEEKSLENGYKIVDQKIRDSQSVFSFLNKFLPNKIQDGDDTLKQKTFAASLKNVDRKSLNLYSFQTDEELRKAEKELLKYRKAYSRNSASSSNSDLASKQLEEKISQLDKRIGHLKRKKSLLEGEQKKNSIKRKLTEF